MLKKIVHISIRSVFPMAAAVYFLVGCATVVGALLAKSSAPGRITVFALEGPVSLSFSGFPEPYILLLWPVVCAVSGAFFSMAIVWLYNFLSPRIGAVSVLLAD